jgi:hypothetical protein
MWYKSALKNAAEELRQLLALLAVALMLLASGCACDGAAPPAPDMTPIVFPSTCEWEALDGGALGCLPDTKDGCICGDHDPVTGGPTGSCHAGACCTGCWDAGDPTIGLAPKCWPGDGTGGLYGSHGATCHSNH